MPKAESMYKKSTSFEDLNQDVSVSSEYRLQYFNSTSMDFLIQILKMQLYFAIFLKIALSKCHFSPL